MRRHRWLAILAAVWFVSAAPALAQDVKDTLRIIPDDAAAFVLTRHLEQSNDQLLSLLQKVSAPPISPLELAKLTFGVSKGLNVKGCAGIAVFAPAGEAEEPVAVYLIPVSDYPQFLAQFKAKDGGISEITLGSGTKMAVASKGKHAVMVEARQRGTLKKFLESTRNLAGWPEPVQAWVASHDVVLSATPHGIKTVTGLMRVGLAQAKPQFAMIDSPSIGAWIDGVETFLKGVSSDVTHAGVGIKMAKGGLSVEARALFAPGSGFANASAGVNASMGGPLAGLPSGPFAIAFGGALSENTMAELMKLNIESIKMLAKAADAKLSKEQAEMMEKAYVNMMRGLRGMSMVMRNGNAGDSLFSGLTATMKVDDAPAYLERYEKGLIVLNALSKELKIPGFNQTYTMKKTMIGKVDVLEVTMKLGDAGEDPLQKKMMEMMFGRGEMVTSVAAADPTTVLFSYKPASTMAETLKVYARTKESLPFDPRVAGTLAMLPQGSQWVLLVEPRGMMSMVGNGIKRIAPDAKFQLPDFPPTPPIGVGARLSETGFTIQTVIPGEVLEGIGKVVQKAN